MSTQEIDPDTEYAQVTVQKTKLGPLTARYVAGDGYVDVDPRTTSDEPSRKVLVGLDNSHSKDYKVAYASDPVVAFTIQQGYTHDQLRETLKAHNLWSDRHAAIEIPHGGGWKAGFATTPERTSMLDVWTDRLKSAADREMDVFEQPHGVSAFVPLADE